MEDLTGNTGIVTGASSGIGRETVKVLADAGMDLVLAARGEERLRAVAEDVVDTSDGALVVIPTDVSDEDAVETLIDETVETFGGLDLLINNAGTACGSDVATLSTEEYRLMMDVNTDGYFFTTRAALPHLENGGQIVYVGSFAGQYPRPSNPVYAATKWWVRGFAKSVAGQYGDRGVAISIVNPSEVRTGIGGYDGEPYTERFEKGEVSEPEEVAETILFAAQRRPSPAFEIDIYREDKLSSM